MPTAEVDVLLDGDSQLIRLPAGYGVRADRVSIRRLGEAVLIEPVHPREWPPGFFESIRSDDPTFVRPDQGQLPPAPRFDEE